MLECNSDGRINFQNVLDAVNTNEANIELIAPVVNDHDTEVTNLRTEVNNHEGRIVTLESEGGTVPALEVRVASLENTDTIFDQRMAVNEADISTLEDGLASANTGIAQNATDIVDLDGRLSGLEGGSDGVLKVSDALTEVSDINKLITQDDVINQLSLYSTSVVADTNKIVTEDVLAFYTGGINFSIIQHKEPTGINGGSSTSGSWEIRTLNDAHEDNLAILDVNNKLNMIAGRYRISGFVVAESAYHQARLYDETSAIVAVEGTSGQGTSFFDSSFALTVDSILRLESQVDVAVPDKGYGEQNPFGNGIFTQLKITRLGD